MTTSRQPAPTLVFDTSAIFNVGHRGRLEALLDKLAIEFRLSTTQVVRDEIKDPARAGYYEVLLKRFVIIPAPGEASQLVEVLDAGEISVLMACNAMGGAARPVLDERAGRREAKGMGIDPWDTLDLLNRALAAVLMTDEECMAAVIRIRKAGGYLPPPAVNDTFADYFRHCRWKGG